MSEQMNQHTSPLYLNESCTERSSNQKGHKNSKRNINIKSAVITIAHSTKNFIYNTVVLQSTTKTNCCEIKSTKLKKKKRNAINCYSSQNKNILF